jgi:hypothetical protein
LLHRCPSFPKFSFHSDTALFKLVLLLEHKLDKFFFYSSKMDHWYVGPPSLPPPFHFQIRVHRLPRHHFRQHIISRFGWNFWMSVVASLVPVILPIMIYGEEWILLIYVLE